MKPSDVARFWAKVDKRGPDECWRWSRSLDESGYGRLGVGASKDIKAHRFSWMLHFGSIPAGMNVCHRCDNPPCVNPSHLFLGTRRDNVRDCVAKGRLRPGRLVGAANHRAKLTQTAADEIRVAHAGGRSVAEIARTFSIGKTTVYRVLDGLVWTGAKP